MTEEEKIKKDYEEMKKVDKIFEMYDSLSDEKKAFVSFYLFKKNYIKEGE